jgi:hypothetical protein
MFTTLVLCLSSVSLLLAQNSVAPTQATSRIDGYDTVAQYRVRKFYAASDAECKGEPCAF